MSCHSSSPDIILISIVGIIPGFLSHNPYKKVTINENNIQKENEAKVESFKMTLYVLISLVVQKILALKSMAGYIQKLKCLEKNYRSRHTPKEKITSPIEGRLLVNVIKLR